MSLALRARSSIRVPPAPAPPSIAVAAISIAACSSRMLPRGREVLVLLGDVHQLDAVTGRERGDDVLDQLFREPTRRR